MSTYLDKSIQLLGEEKIKSLGEKTILLIGLGGVGGTALEALARSGIKNFVLIDFDKVDNSNLNRQILYTSVDVSRNKVDVAKERILKICSEINIRTLNTKIEENTLNNIGLGKVDFIIDAIDYIPGKLHIIDFSLKNKIPFITSLGMGNRLNPEDVCITKLNKTENDPLAKKLRYEVKLRGLDLKEVNVVFSKEIPLIKSPKPASMMMVPSTAGLLIAKYVLSTIL